MKIALLTDLHFGVRNALPVLLDNQRKFFDTQFFPYITSNNITDLIILGDTFDVRKTTNNYIIKQSKEILFDRLMELGINTTIIVGNHDSYHKDTIDVNTIDLLLSDYTNIEIINKPKQIYFDGKEFALIPWICQDNEKSCFSFIQESTAQYCLGHFEVSGFQMYRGIESHHGINPSIFKSFRRTLSGHYHHRSSSSNITYLGTAYEMNWQDFNDPKGFHILDTETDVLEFIQNPNTLFVRLDYDEINGIPDLDDMDLIGCFVKVVVINKIDFYKFDQFIQKLYNKKCYEVKIVEDFSEFNDQSIQVDTEKMKDTKDLLLNYIDSIQTDYDISKIKAYVQGLYIEAINSENQ